MKQGWFLAIVVACLLLVSGIAGCEAGTDEKTSTNLFLGGTTGISAAFLPDTPPDMVYKGQAFEIGVSVKNFGEFQSDKVIVSLFGLNQQSFGIASLDKTLMGSLEGKSLYQPDYTAEDEVVYSANYKEDIKADFKPLVKADVCYIYGTYAIADVCLKKDVFTREQGSVCEPGAVVYSENSGAPVQITGITAIKSGNNKVKLTFTVENLGGGEVYLNDAFDSSCKGKIEKKDKVLLELDSTTIVPISCTKFEGGKQGEVGLVANKRVVSCEIDTAELQDAAFRERLNFNVYYFYKTSVSKELTIKA